MRTVQLEEQLGKYWNEKRQTTWNPASAWCPLDAPLRYADDLSCFVERLLLLRTRITAGVPFIGVACCPVVRSKQYRGTCDRTALGQEDRNFEIRNGRWNLEGTTPEGRIKTLRVVQPISGSWGNGFQIAFGNQTIFLTAQSRRTKEEDSRLCVPTSRQVCLYRCNQTLERTS